MKKYFLFIIFLFSVKLFSQEILKFNEAGFEFCLTKVCEEQECEITKIEIIKNGSLLQEITPGKNYFSTTFPNDQLFAIEDMNFDGKIDFRLIEFLPAGPNVPFLFWMYNPAKNIFEKNTEYAAITSPEFDHQKKEINSAWRDGCCRHGRDIFKLKNGVPKITERFIIGHNEEDKEYYEHWKAENGNLKLVEKTVD